MRSEVERRTDDVIVHLAVFPRLRSLTIHEPEATDTGLGQLKPLTKLELLGIQGSKVTDAGLQSLKAMTALKELWIMNMGRSVSNPAIQDLQVALPSLKSVR